MFKAGEETTRFLAEQLTSVGIIGLLVFLLYFIYFFLFIPRQTLTQESGPISRLDLIILKKLAAKMI